jgi:hypothetical protein
VTSELVWSGWSASRPTRLIPGNHWIGGWVDPRARLDDVEKRKFLTLPGLELRALGRPARCQSLYRLRYPGSIIIIVSGMWLRVRIRLTNKLFHSHRCTRYVGSKRHWPLWLCKRRMREQSAITRQGLQLTLTNTKSWFASKMLILFKIISIWEVMEIYATWISHSFSVLKCIFRGEGLLASSW